MRTIEAASQSTDTLNLRLIEASGVLPVSTTYFAEPMPGTSASARQRALEREAWFDRARRAVADKYATVPEITALLRTGAAAVLYQHGNRTPWPEQRRQVCAQLAAVGQPVTIRTVRFGAFGVRAFFCVAATPRRVSVIERGLALFSARVDGWDKASYLLIE